MSDESFELVRLTAENAELRALVAKQQEQIAKQQAQIELQQQQLRVIQDYVRRLLRGRFGTKTEALIGGCLGQEIIQGMEMMLSAEERAAAEGRPDVCDPKTGAITPGRPAPIADAAVSAATPESPASEPPVTPASVEKPAKRKPRRGPKLSQQHPELPVDTTVLEPAAEDLIDSDGRLKVKIDEEITETLAIEGPRVSIKRIVRPRYASVATGGERVTAALPARITPGGILDDSAIHHLMEQRYSYSVPFFRSLTMIAMLGIELARSTINDAAADWAKVMAPLAAAIRAEIWTSPLIFVDHAVMRQQDPARDGTCARIPVFTATDGEQSWFYAPPTLNDTRAVEVLAGYPGKWIADDWSGWRKMPPHAGCNAHGRRPFAELQTVSTEAGGIVQLYAQVYHHETIIAETAAREGLTGQNRLDFRVAHRQQHSAPIMARIRTEAEAIARRHPPRTTLGNGARYVIRLWPELTAFLKDGLLKPDNNTAERALRTIALNRKNSLFLGTGKDSPIRAATAWTIFGSCRQQGIPATNYLAEITPVLLDWRTAERAKRPLPDLGQLTPKAWASRQAIRELVRVA